MLVLAESFFLCDMKSRISANPPEFLRLGDTLPGLSGPTVAVTQYKIATKVQDIAQRGLEV